MTATAHTTKLLTADEFEALPDADRFELIAGELHDHMSSRYEHSRFAKRIDGPLWQYADQHGLGEVISTQASFRIGEAPGTIVIPDVAFVAQERVPNLVTARHIVRFAPDLAIEVLSKEAAAEISKKVQLYLEAGTRLVWLVDPVDEAVTIFRTGRSARTSGIDDVLDGEDVVPGFTLPVAKIFRP